MPLDGTTLSRDRYPVYRGGTLRDVANGLGIIPVPEILLLAHKHAELRKHPGSLLFHYSTMAQDVLGSLFIIGLLGTSASVFGLAMVLLCGKALWAGIMALAILSSSCLCAATTFVMFMYRVKEPAQWVEAIPDSLEGIPPQLAAIALDIKINHVGSYLVVGKLIQNRVLLDPYLTVQTRHGDEIVIGIWDSEKIIASATRL